MPINVAQENYGQNIGAGTTITCSLSNTQAGSVFAVATYGSSSVTAGITDSQGNTFTPKTPVDNAGASTRLTLHYAPNIAGGAAANTFTCTYSGSTSNRFIAVAEIRLATLTAFDGFKTRYQTGPGTSTDGATTQSDAGSTNANQPALIWAICCIGNSATTVTAGTGFTQGLQLTPVFSGLCVGTENARVTNTAAQAATFTLSANNNALMGLLIFDELAQLLEAESDTAAGYQDLSGNFKG